MSSAIASGTGGIEADAGRSARPSIFTEDVREAMRDAYRDLRMSDAIGRGAHGEGAALDIRFITDETQGLPTKTACWFYDKAKKTSVICLGEEIGEHVVKNHDRFPQYAQAYVKHEGAHDRWTARDIPKLFAESKKHGVTPQQLNLWEDARIEHKARVNWKVNFGWSEFEAEPAMSAKNPYTILNSFIWNEGKRAKVQDHATRSGVASNVVDTVESYYREAIRARKTADLIPLAVRFREEFTKYGGESASAGARSAPGAAPPGSAGSGAGGGSSDANTSGGSSSGSTGAAAGGGSSSSADAASSSGSTGAAAGGGSSSGADAGGSTSGAGTGASNGGSSSSSPGAAAGDGSSSSADAVCSFSGTGASSGGSSSGGAGATSTGEATGDYTFTVTPRAEDMAAAGELGADKRRRYIVVNSTQAGAAGVADTQKEEAKGDPDLYIGTSAQQTVTVKEYSSGTMVATEDDLRRWEALTSIYPDYVRPTSFSRRRVEECAAVLAPAFRGAVVRDYREDPTRRFDARRHVNDREDCWAYAKPVGYAGKRRVGILYDCSGSMTVGGRQSAHTQGKELVLALGEMAEQGRIEGAVIFHKIGQQGQGVWETMQLPIGPKILANILPDGGGEGIAFAMEGTKDYLRSCDFVGMYTDGNIIDQPLDKGRYQSQGIFTYGLYAGNARNAESLSQYCDYPLIAGNSNELAQLMAQQIATSGFNGHRR